MEARLVVSAKVKIVNIEGDVTLGNAEKFSALIKDAIDEKPMVLVSLSQSVDIDLCGIQLIYAAKRYALKKRRSFHITGAIPETIARRLYQAGFASELCLDGRELDTSLVEFGNTGTNNA